MADRTNRAERPRRTLRGSRALRDLRAARGGILAGWALGGDRRPELTVVIFQTRRQIARRGAVRPGGALLAVCIARGPDATVNAGCHAPLTGQGLNRGTSRRIIGAHRTLGGRQGTQGTKRTRGARLADGHDRGGIVLPRRARRRVGGLGVTKRSGRTRNLGGAATLTRVADRAG